MHFQNNKYITIIGAARKTEVKSSIIKEWIMDGIIESVDGQIKLNDVEKIIKEKNKYISFEEYLNLVKMY